MGKNFFIKQNQLLPAVFEVVLEIHVKGVVVAPPGA